MILYIILKKIFKIIDIKVMNTLIMSEMLYIIIFVKYYFKILIAKQTLLLIKKKKVIFNKIVKYFQMEY